jgi:uncharacterized protein
MEILPALVDFAFFSAVALLWARWAKLDLGLRAPTMKGAWPWMLLFLAWIAAERMLTFLFPVEADPAWLDQMAGLSLFQSLLLLVVLAPICEELLFRGAFFSALMRRWGIWVAAVVPSFLWALGHIQYSGWFLLSLAGSGILLAIIRWKSGSLYPPLVLHAAANLEAMLNSPLPLPWEG